MHKVDIGDNEPIRQRDWAVAPYMHWQAEARCDRSTNKSMGNPTRNRYTGKKKMVTIMVLSVAKYGNINFEPSKWCKVNIIDRPQRRLLAIQENTAKEKTAFGCSRTEVAQA